MTSYLSYIARLRAALSWETAEPANNAAVQASLELERSKNKEFHINPLGTRRYSNLFEGEIMEKPAHIHVIGEIQGARIVIADLLDDTFFAASIDFYEFCPTCGADLKKVLLYEVPHGQDCTPDIETGIKCTCWKQEFRKQIIEDQKL